MKKTTFLSIILGVFFACKTVIQSQESSLKNDFTNEKIKITSIDTFDYNALEPLLHKKDNKTYVINFWATWCKPCIEELPSFEKLNKIYKNKNVEVILVSLDFPNQVDKRVIPFINEHNLQSKVILMTDSDQNT